MMDLSPDETKAIFICPDCAKERGYRWPYQGSVHEIIGKCDMCGARGLMFDRDDLVPPGEDP